MIVTRENKPTLGWPHERKKERNDASLTALNKSKEVKKERARFSTAHPHITTQLSAKAELSELTAQQS